MHTSVKIIFYLLLVCNGILSGCFNWNENIVTYTTNIKSIEEFLADNALPYRLSVEQKERVLSIFSDDVYSGPNVSRPNRTTIEAIIGAPDIENSNRSEYKGVVTESRDCIYILEMRSRDFSTATFVSIEYNSDGLCQRVQHWDREVCKQTREMLGK